MDIKTVMIFSLCCHFCESSIPLQPILDDAESSGELDTTIEPPRKEVEDTICNAEICYRLTNVTGTWNSSLSECESRGTQLAVIPEESQNSWLAENLGRLLEPPVTEVWFGAIRRDNVTQWHTGGLIPDDRFIMSDESLGDEDSCGVMVHTGTDLCTWILTSCETMLRYGLCQSVSVNKEDGGLSDGEIAAIAVCSSLAVAGAAAGGGYYAYSKSKKTTPVHPDSKEADLDDQGKSTDAHVI